jgi:hypothetical protein
MRADRDLPADRFNPGVSPSKKFWELFRAEILPRLRIGGRKISRKEQVAAQIAYSLVTSGLNGKAVGDPRNSRNEFRYRLWDLFEDAGLCSKELGSELGRVVTRYRATTELLTIRKRWTRKELDAQETDAPGLIVVHDKETDEHEPIAEYDRRRELAFLVDETGQPIEISSFEDLFPRDGPPTRLAEWMAKNLSRAELLRALFDKPAFWKLQAERLDQINRTNLRHSWLAEREEIGGDGRPQRIAFQPAVTLRQTFSGQPFEHGRFYTYGPGGAQSMKREHRRSLRIDGEPTGELDFNAYHLSMLYHRKAKQDPPFPDGYAPERVFPRFWSFRNTSEGRRKALRDLLKRFIGVAFNKVRGRGQAVGAGRKLLKEADRNTRRIIYETEKAGAAELFQRIEDVHAPVAPHFYQNIANYLMLYDTLMMQWILEVLTGEDTPVLCLHDGILVRRSDEDWARGLMEELYERAFHFKPRISTKE